MRPLTLVLLAACASAPKPAPKSPDPKQLALDRHQDLHALADVAQRTHGNCDALVAELRPLVARMRAHASDIHRADPKQMTRELHAYDVDDRGLDETTGKQLADTYLGCKQNQTLLDLIDQIPTE